MAGCRYYLCDVKPTGVVAITVVISQMARVFPKQMAQLIEPLLPMVLRKLLQEDVGGVIVTTDSSALSAFLM